MTNQHKPSRRLHEPTGYTFQALSLKHRVVGNKPESQTVSIKYPLSIPSTTLSTISSWLTHDAALISPLASYPPHPVYTLIDFWTDALRLGFVFGGSGAELYQHYNTASRDQAFAAIVSYLKSRYQIEVTNTADQFGKSFAASFRSTTGGDFHARLTTKLVRLIRGESKEEVPSAVLTFASQSAALITPTMTGSEQSAVLERIFGTSPTVFRTKDKLSLTCVPDPELSRTPLPDSAPPEQVFYDRYLSLCESLADNKLASQALGFCQNFNNLSNFFNSFVSLLSSAPSQLAADITSLVPSWAGEPERLMSVLKELARHSSHLLPPEFPTVSSLADYRMVVGGKLQSWWTNYQKHRDRLAEYPKKLEDDLVKLAKNYPLVSQIQALLPGLADPATYETCRDLLANLRDEVTRASAKDASASEDWQKKLSKDYPTLFSNLPKYPAFYGAVIGERLNSLTQAPALLSSLYSHLLSLLPHLPKLPTHKVPRDLDAKPLAALRRHLDNTVLLVSSLRTSQLRSTLSDLLTSLGITLYDKQSKSRYYLHPRAKNLGNATELTLREDTYQVLSRFDEAVFEHLSTPYSSNLVLLADHIELAKRLVAARLALGDTGTIPKIALALDTLPTLPIAVYAPHLTNDDPSHRQIWLRLYLNRVVLSNLRGLLTQASRTHAIERTTLTHIGTDSKWPLILAVDTSRRSGHLPDSLQDNLAYHHHTWHLALPVVSPPPLAPQLDYYQFAKDGSYKYLNPHELSRYILLPLRTSHVELQHLESLLYTPKKKVGLTTSFGEPSLIFERALERVGDTWQGRGERLFVNFPLTYTRVTNPAKPSLSHTLLPHRYLGIDVGEYGLAYALIEGDNDGKTCKLLSSGFLTEPEHRAIRQEVAALKSRQVAGTLTSSSTKLERLRDSASSAYHHRLLNLAYRFKAQLVFEHEIDAFETGGNRIKVLYRSIKQGLTLGDSKVDKDVFKATWGRASWTHPPATVVSAYATSTICPACGRSLYQIDSVGVPISRSNHLYEAKAHLHHQESTPLVTLYTKAVNPEFKYPRQLAYAAARPPYQDGPTGLLRRTTLTPPALSSQASKRGNQAIFLCPFVECKNHVIPLDADLQAAINIAVKQYSQVVSPVSKSGDKAQDKDQKRTSWFTFVQQLVQAQEYPEAPLQI